jgi:glycosyltransferase involved in cell wall biosynthesis
MKSVPKVSVVVPMYNVEKYIEKCIDSILAQTFTNFEIICVDDGCKDNTVQKLKKYTDERIQIVHQANKGLAAARNTGINISKGDYVAFLDSDDYWHPRKLEVHVTHLHDNPDVGVSYSPSLFVDDNNCELGIGQFPKIYDITSRDILCRNPIGNGSAPVLRRATLDAVRELDLMNHHFNFNYFDPKFRQSEDLECWLRISLNTKWKFEGVEEPLTYYRVNTEGLSANVTAQLDTWQRVMMKSRIGHEKFFKKWFSLAEAYQERYLARRSVQSGEGLKALKMMHIAIAHDPRIIIQEPSRTLITYAACWVSLIPTRLFRGVQRVMMNLMGRFHVS